MEEDRSSPESREEFTEHFMEALFETYKHQYGECTITEITEEKPA